MSVEIATVLSTARDPLLQMLEYTVEYTGGHCIRVSHLNGYITVLRIPYSVLKEGRADVDVPNKFVVYILYGRNPDGRDAVYVGKSTNGLRSRPLSHEDKCGFWTDCFVLTTGDSRFFSDGVIQYIENRLDSIVSGNGLYENTTLATTENSANDSEKEKAEKYLSSALIILDVLGLRLISVEPDKPVNTYSRNHKEKNRNSIDICEHLDDKKRSLAAAVLQCLQEVDRGCYLNGNPRYIAACSPEQTVVYLVPRKDGFLAYMYGDLSDHDTGSGLLFYRSGRYGACRTCCEITGLTDVDRLSGSFKRALELVRTKHRKSGSS